MPHWDWLWCAEIEKFPRAVLAVRHPESVNLGDVNAENFVARAEAIGRPDVVVFGSPCQDFSVAGRRVGLDGDRGNLALVALGIVNRLRPRWVVFENVPGLLSSRSGSAEAERSVREGSIGARSDGDEDSDFAAFLALVQQCGYLGCYRIIDAQYAGVPQRRRRIFAIFHLGDWRPAVAVLFEPEGLRGDHPPSRETRQEVAGAIGAGSARSGGRIGRREAAANHVIPICESGKRANVKDSPKNDIGIGKPGYPSFTIGTDSRHAIMAPLAFGGNNTSGPIDVATARNSHPGPAGRQDFESETFIVEVAKTVVAGGPARNPLDETLIVFDETQITSAENRCQPRNGDPSHPLAASPRPPAIAFEHRQRGDDGRGYDRDPNFMEDVSPSINTVKQPVVAFAW
jgi:DNA (cytosine-5)-methyltransferase 1